MNIANYFQTNQMIAKVEKVQRSKERSLSLEDFDLNEFPEIILSCDSLRSLNLQRNQIIDLPRDIGLRLQNLKYLSIQFNNLQCFPECLKHIRTLVSLNISHNPIKSLIEDIHCMKNLEYLWCNSCGITCLPKSLGDLERLETFGARNNEISILPESIVNLKELRWLSLEGNRIDSLPSDFYKLTNLHHLNLNRNCFSEIPDVLPKRSTLLYLHLQRNNIKLLDKEIIIALSGVNIILINNPLENGQEFAVFKNLMLNPADYMSERNSNNNNQDVIPDSPEWDSDWANSTDTFYLNYSSSGEESDIDEEYINVPNISKFILGH